MKLNIHSVAGHGDQTSERIQFSVVDDCNLDHFIVADTTFIGPDRVSNKVRHTHWFRPLDVRAGDAVILYTRDGVPVSTARSDGGTNHFLYWGLAEPVWNDTGDAAMLFEVGVWQGSRVQ